MTVGLFGGTFDPPHLGHLQVSQCVQSQYGLDEVWWICAFSPPHKDKTGITPFRHRLAMTQLAVSDCPSMRASDIESELPQPSYTVSTIRALQRRFPAHEFVLVMGQDSLEQFGTWYRPQDIANRVRLLVYPRRGCTATKVAGYLEGRFQLMHLPVIEMESVAIRSMIRKHQSVDSYVSDAVAAYISAHGLYRDQSSDRAERS